MILTDKLVLFMIECIRITKCGDLHRQGCYLALIGQPNFGKSTKWVKWEHERKILDYKITEGWHSPNH